MTWYCWATSPIKNHLLERDLVFCCGRGRAFLAGRAVFRQRDDGAAVLEDQLQRDQLGQQEAEGPQRLEEGRAVGVDHPLPVSAQARLLAPADLAAALDKVLQQALQPRRRGRLAELHRDEQAL